MKKTGDIYLRSEYAKSEGTTRDTNQTILRPGLLIYSPVVLILGTISGISMCLMLAM